MQYTQIQVIWFYLLSVLWGCSALQYPSLDLVPLFGLPQFLSCIIKFICNLKSAQYMRQTTGLGLYFWNMATYNYWKGSQGWRKAKKEPKRRLKGLVQQHPLGPSCNYLTLGMWPVTHRNIWSIDNASPLGGFSSGVHSFPCSREMWSCWSSTQSPVFMELVTPGYKNPVFLLHSTASDCNIQMAEGMEAERLHKALVSAWTGDRR